MRQTNIRMVEPQKETIRDVPISKDQEEALLRKYYPEMFKKEIEKEKPLYDFNQKKATPRKDSDNLYQKTNKEFIDTKFINIGLDGLTGRLEIRSDMKLP